MTARQPDPIPHWQVVAGGYETPTEENFVEIKQVYSLAEWIAAHAEEAPRLLGKKNTRLKLAKVRIQIWPANVRHTNFQLRAIWQYCNERCWQLAPYAFNTDLRPYAEFAWVVYSTKIRFSSDETTLTIAERPALAAPLVNTVKHTNSTDNRRSAVTALETLSRPSVNKAEPPPNASRTPKSRTNGDLPQAAHTPGPHPATPKEMSRTLGKAPVRSAEAPFGSPSQPPSMRPPRPADSRMSKTTPASGLKSGHAPELTQPPPKTLLNKTGTLNAAVKSQSSAQALHHRDHTQPFEARTHHEPTSQTTTSKEKQIQSNLLQDSGHSLRHEAEQARIPYSPTPGPSSSSTHPRIEPVSDVRPPYREGAKTPGPSNGKKAVGSVELGTPRLHSTHKHSPSIAAQELVPAQSSRAEGKQLSRSATSSVDVPSPKGGKQLCKTFATSDILELAISVLYARSDTKALAITAISALEYTSESVTSASHASCDTPESVITAGYVNRDTLEHVTTVKNADHGMCPSAGACIYFRPPPARQLFSSGSGEKVAPSTTVPPQPRKKTTPLPEVVAKEVETPMRARQTDATASLASGPAASTRSAEMPNNEVKPCKHRQNGQECTKCRAEARAGKRKADDPDVKVEPSASDTQLASVPKKKKPRIRDSVDPVVKVEEPAMQLSQLPKKKKKKLRTRDSVGSWYDPIEMD
ncbi:hypothetical protein KCU71_g3897, partial [Aureobasidium melanogenum]